jgi:DNA polymerase-3 subunit epsilon
MRQIVLDTETTGLNPDEGHRIIEIGCVELLNRKLTRKHFHVYLNPEREIDQGAVEVHGLDNKFLADKPLFAHVVDDFIAFVQGAELIIHNAPFDTGFINAELRRNGKDYQIQELCGVLDTLVFARKKHPGQRNTLDALCKRYSVSNAHRELHGALLDAEILAEVYLAMTGGQSALLLEAEETVEIETNPEKSTENIAIPATRNRRTPLTVIRCDEAELQLHRQKLQAVAKSSGGRCIWEQ